MKCSNHADRERVAFCQNCGKPLCTECTRAVGAAVFCEPCLAARLAAADVAAAQANAAAGGTPYGYGNVGVYSVPPVPPIAPGAPNPLLAGALGFIPGVGAMYNGQYAKGVVHLGVFTVLVSLANDVNGLFGLFVAGWEFYQAFEAYHTARARRDGAPLPNPFGLNDIGERLGFGKGWGVSNWHAATPGAGGVAEKTMTPESFTGSFGAKVDGAAFVSQSVPVPPYVEPSVQPTASGTWAPTMSSYGYPAAGVGAPLSPGAGNAFAGGVPPSVARNFPVGAVLLIFFGLLFFFGSTGLFRGFPVQRVIPFLLIGTGVWIFYQRMTRSGLGFGDDGTPMYSLRLFRAARGGVWVVLVGVLFLLDSFNILSWGHSWPLFIILGGLMTFFERAALNAAGGSAYAPPVQPLAPSTQVPVEPVATPPSTSEEGS